MNMLQFLHSVALTTSHLYDDIQVILYKAYRKGIAYSLKKLNTVYDQ